MLVSVPFSRSSLELGYRAQVLTLGSHVLFEKSDCRYFAVGEAASRRGLGYVVSPPPTRPRAVTHAITASRMNAVGHVVGYGAGAIDLVQILGNTLGQTQFQQLTLIAATAILATTATTCWAVRESVLVSSKGSKPQSSFGVLGQIYSTVRHLPPRIEAICWAQFWSWIGWFPFLFYSTTWVGETYFRYDIPADARQSEDVLGEMGRIGSKSLVMYSFITCTGSFVLPLFVKSPDEEPYTARPPQAVAGFLKRFEDMKPDLLSTWIFGHIMFAASMSLAPFATSFRFATTLVCLCGL